MTVQQCAPCSWNVIPIASLHQYIFFHSKKKSQSNLGRAALPPPRQRIDSPACASCAIPTADESIHSASGRPTLNPLYSAKFSPYVTLRCLIFLPRKKIGSPLQSPPRQKKNHPWAHLTHHPKRHLYRLYSQYTRQTDRLTETVTRLYQ